MTSIRERLNVTAARFVDLSHSIENGMVTYKGLPAPLVCDYLSREQSRAVYAADTQFQIGRIEMVSNTPARIWIRCFIVTRMATIWRDSSSNGSPAELTPSRAVRGGTAQ